LLNKHVSRLVLFVNFINAATANVIVRVIFEQRPPSVVDVGIGIRVTDREVGDGAERLNPTLKQSLASEVGLLEVDA
jgi:hypothetical protein